MADQIEIWNDKVWSEIQKDLGDPEFHHIHLKGESLYPFESILMLSGKSRLVFQKRIFNIKLGDHIYVFGNNRALMLSGWVTSVDGQVVDLYGDSGVCSLLQKLGPSEHK